MKDKIYLDNNLLKAKKSCELCAHKSVCKFYSKAEALFKSKEFYEMTEYLEWNNNLQAWCENSSCQFYTPFIFDKVLFIAESKKQNSYIYSFSWYNIIKVYFKENLFHKYEDYFKQELEKVKLNSWAKDKSDEDLYSHCYDLFSSNHVYTFKSKNGGKNPLDSWEEKINLVDALEYFKAFEKI